MGTAPAFKLCFCSEAAAPGITDSKLQNRGRELKTILPPLCIGAHVSYSVATSLGEIKSPTRMFTSSLGKASGSTSAITPAHENNELHAQSYGDERVRVRLLGGLGLG